jgi:hypothetical protein
MVCLFEFIRSSLDVVYPNASNKSVTLIFWKLEAIKHDVKPRVLPRGFSRRFGDASAQTKIFAAKNAVWEKHRFVAGAPEFDSRKAG